MTTTLDAIAYPIRCLCGHVEQGGPPAARSEPSEPRSAKQPEVAIQPSSQSKMSTAVTSPPDTAPHETISGVYIQAPSGSGPSLLTRAANFTKAAAQHVAAGMPRCDQVEIDRRFAICTGCEYRTDDLCQVCGCWIRREPGAVSKLAWADQHCPIGKW